ncbi:hypothetical protein ATK86_6402 [Nocardia fluminea]|uniref:Uncharacterized protein n=1 Tax=Nocardia fluminea TaxID=134984 RepID=A0A2N3VJY7_9NOCA|nr:hypothetical protein ATK86_6402 [Nocardia fluminea]
MTRPQRMAPRLAGERQSEDRLIDSADLWLSGRYRCDCCRTGSNNESGFGTAGAAKSLGDLSREIQSHED